MRLKNFYYLCGGNWFDLRVFLLTNVMPAFIISSSIQILRMPLHAQRNTPGAVWVEIFILILVWRHLRIDRQNPSTPLILNKQKYGYSGVIPALALCRSEGAIVSGSSGLWRASCSLLSYSEHKTKRSLVGFGLQFRLGLWIYSLLPWRACGSCGIGEG